MLAGSFIYLSRTKIKCQAAIYVSNIYPSHSSVKNFKTKVLQYLKTPKVLIYFQNKIKQPFVVYKGRQIYIYPQNKHKNPTGEAYNKKATLVSGFSNASNNIHGYIYLLKNVVTIFYNPIM